MIRLSKAAVQNLLAWTHDQVATAELRATEFVANWSRNNDTTEMNAQTLQRLHSTLRAARDQRVVAEAFADPQVFHIKIDFTQAIHLEVSRTNHPVLLQPSSILKPVLTIDDEEYPVPDWLDKEIRALNVKVEILDSKPFGWSWEPDDG